LIIDDLFYFYNARSKGFETYSRGSVPFVTNGFKNNGIIGFVKPRQLDRVFDKNAICVSAFCEATVQKAPFIPRGNGGSGLLVLVPKQEMTLNELFFHAGYINLTHSWRFSYGRMVTKERIMNLKLTNYGKGLKIENPEKLIPKKQNLDQSDPIFKKMNFLSVKLTSLFDPKRGEGGYLENLEKGRTPLISATNEDNGLADYVALTPIFKAPAITIERVTGTAFVQLDDFVTVPDDLVVLIPKEKVPPSFLFFVCGIINQERWRYSYSRKLTKGRIELMNLTLPCKDNKVDFEIIDKYLQTIYGWKEIYSCI
jgi:hypothetical protein